MEKKLTVKRVFHANAHNHMHFLSQFRQRPIIISLMELIEGRMRNKKKKKVKQLPIKN